VQPLNLCRSRSSSKKPTRSGMGARRHIASHLDHHLDPLSLSTLFRSAAVEPSSPRSSQNLLNGYCIGQIRLIAKCYYYRFTDRAQGTRHLLANLAPSIKHHDAHIGTALCRDQKPRCSRDSAGQIVPGHGCPKIHGIWFNWSNPEVR
jgi:hypothetical protein